jgi:hypothetical protein
MLVKYFGLYGCVGSGYRHCLRISNIYIQSPRQHLATATHVDHCDAFSFDFLPHRVSFTREPLLSSYQIGQMIPASEIHIHLQKGTLCLRKALANQVRCLSHPIYSLVVVMPCVGHSAFGKRQPPGEDASRAELYPSRAKPP